MTWSPSPSSRAITGVGGGTLRDLLIGAPVFWVQDWRYIAVCLAAALAVWLVGAGATGGSGPCCGSMRSGWAAYGVMGAAKAEAFGVPPLICIVMGALTACFGGIVRDILAGQPSILLRREITVSAALLAATVYVVARAARAGSLAGGAGRGAARVRSRAGALAWGWSLPAFPGGLVTD